MYDPDPRAGMKSYLPNYITFLSLGFGLVSIILSVQTLVYLAGIFIIGAVLLDSVDGYLARKLSLESDFGLELDSLTDMVCFGVAPIVLVSQHLHLGERFSFWLMPLFLLQIWAGAFRLARFNLQPRKESSGASSLGLTISLSGLIITLLILADITQDGTPYPLLVIIGNILLVCFLMVSRLQFPPLSWFIPNRILIGVYLVAVVVLAVLYSIFTAVWILWLMILLASMIRHLADRRQVKLTM